jgi:hypothetical protein
MDNWRQLDATTMAETDATRLEILVERKEIAVAANALLTLKEAPAVSRHLVSERYELHGRTEQRHRQAA